MFRRTVLHLARRRDSGSAYSNALFRRYRKERQRSDRRLARVLLGPSRSGLSDLGVSIAAGRLNLRQLRPVRPSYRAPLVDRHPAIVETPGRSVECLVADRSVTAGATTSRVLMIAVNSPEISGFAHFVKHVKKSFAVFDGISDGPGAISVLNNPVRRCRSEGVFDEYAVGGHLCSLALMRTGAGTVA